MQGVDRTAFHSYLLTHTHTLREKHIDLLWIEYGERPAEDAERRLFVRPGAEQSTVQSVQNHESNWKSVQVHVHDTFTVVNWIPVEQGSTTPTSNLNLTIPIIDYNKLWPVPW